MPSQSISKPDDRGPSAQNPSSFSAVARLIAFYLPQFHPIPENDEWWGKGFTEWTNVTKAKPMFPGHYQPHLPADLGYYDLRVPETRLAQAAMARQYGIEAFCYYHYWFGDKQLLERPFAEVLASGRPDFPFCICWANQTWTGIWHGCPGRILIEQTYPGEEDHQRHFDLLLPAFQDQRYVRVDGKPLFIIYRPMQLPDVRRTTDYWRTLAVRAGLPGLHLVGVAESSDWQPALSGYDASIVDNMPPYGRWVSRRKPLKWLRQRYQDWRGYPTVHEHERVLSTMLPETSPGIRTHPCIVPNWDNTPRSGKNGLVLHGSTPELFRILVRKALEVTRGESREDRLIFIKSWNEWAEGNYLEPDQEFGHAYLQVIREELLAQANGNR